MKSLRNTNIEILRFILISFVCLWHVCVFGFQFMNVGTDAYEYKNSVLIPFFSCLFSPAVYCFMFISGYFGIRFKLEKLLSLCFMAMLCYVFGRTIQLATNMVSLERALRYAFPISTRYWWFLTFYVFVYAISPVINKGMESLNKKELYSVILLLTFFEVFSLLTFASSAGSTFFGLLYIYMLGRFLKECPIKFSWKKWGYIYLGSLLFLFLLVYQTALLQVPYSKIAFILLGYNNPLIILMSVSLFMIFLGIPPYYNSKLNDFLSPILTVYLLVDMLGPRFYSYIASLIVSHSIIRALCLLLIVITVCLLIGNVLCKIADKLGGGNSGMLKKEILVSLAR